MQGIAINRDGKMWSGEHGPRGGDGLNHIAFGENYGWPEETHGTRYNKFLGHVRKLRWWRGSGDMERL
ncbi:MAG: PQQ-dependent sugar dehydrogenase [Hyphomicrobium sp.]